jgi:hypothetical protein
MPLQPLTVTLSAGQQKEAMKRFRVKYADELTKLEAELTEVLTAIAEADFLVQYLGEQPEIKDLKRRQAEVEALQQRRIYLSKIIERLDQYTPQEKPVAIPVPSSGAPAAPKPGGGGIKRY